MLVVFPSIFLADTKILHGYNFIAPLIMLPLWNIKFLASQISDDTVMNKKSNLRSLKFSSLILGFRRCLQEISFHN